ncbi:hypothetical protein FJ950_02730 [Mesorhizobium sp. B2-3-14]|uniref:hypothetical protein n=1 Tax=Mesorhizobium sp. B2-3-14 TaxID=2589950 RepID=UPI00112BC347|nr:hypothetical protein [Mesorhizobium sp. B2-3-14]TPL89287.1 hypothetical protein FJ950_02730 [Mesorhizobium sp. B2-3-14]
MASDEVQVVRINSEQAAWDTLTRLLSGDLRASQISLDLSDLQWTKVHVVFKGEPFHQTVTASIMSGLVEFQNDLYRSVARLLKNDGRITRLTDKEKNQLELVFSVTEGSSDIWATAAESLGALGKAVEKLNSKQSLIAVLAFLILFFGAAGGYIYLSHVETMKKIEAEQKGREFDSQEKKDLYDFIERMLHDKQAQAATIKRATRQSAAASDIAQFSDHAVDEILRASGNATEVVYQGLKMDAEVISAITASRRAKSEKMVLHDTFLVTALETDNVNSYRVHLESTSGDWILAAELEDPLVGSKYQRAIQNAEWNHTPVTVHIVGRRVGDSIRDAKIKKAFTPRKRKATVA